MREEDTVDTLWQLPSNATLTDNFANNNSNDTPFSLSVNSSLIMDPLTPSSCQSTDYVSHSRTSSLPTLFKLGVNNVSTPSTPAGIRSASFSTPLIPVPLLSILPEQQLASPFRQQDELERQLGALTIDASPIQSLSRRNTVFSNASVSTQGTSKSIIAPPSQTSLSMVNSLGFITNGKLPTVNNGNNNSIDTIPSVSKDDILLMSRDQHGCRLLQRKLDEDFNGNFSLIFNVILPHSSQLMVDPFGNYLIQKIMSLASPAELSLIMMEISPNIGTISVNPHGTRAVQKLVDCISTDEHHQIINRAISNYIVDLVHDLNGNHVIQKVISHFNGQQLDFLVDLIIINLIPITTHKHGCCVLQKLMAKCSPQQVVFIGEQILNNGIYLMQDQFGNYVVQFLLSLELDYINNTLLHLVASDVVNLSCGKFSSNVVEKCLRVSLPPTTDNTAGLNPIMVSLVSLSVLNTLIKDQYGNYVVQTTLDVADWNIKCVLVELMRPILPGIRYTSYGKRIYSKAINIAKEMEKLGIATGSHW